MEEKEVTFNIFTDDNEGGSALKITSDIDDCIEYLSISEKIGIILELIAQCTKQLIDINHDDIEDYSEDNDVQNETIDSVYSFQTDLVKLVINTVHNALKVQFKQEPEILDYSMVTYYTDKDEKNVVNQHKSLHTFHSDGVYLLDSLYAIFDLYYDIISTSVYHNIPKEYVVDLVNKSLHDTKTSLLDLIDEAYKEA